MSIAVAGFFIPLFGVDVDVLGFDCLTGSSLLAVAVAVAAVFLRFLDPGDFLRECVRPCSASLRPRAIRRCLSAS